MTLSTGTWSAGGWELITRGNQKKNNEAFKKRLKEEEEEYE